VNPRGYGWSPDSRWFAYEEGWGDRTVYFVDQTRTKVTSFALGKPPDWNPIGDHFMDFGPWNPDGHLSFESLEPCSDGRNAEDPCFRATLVDPESGTTLDAHYRGHLVSWSPDGSTALIRRLEASDTPGNAPHQTIDFVRLTATYGSYVVSQITTVDSLSDEWLTPVGWPPEGYSLLVKGCALDVPENCRFELVDTSRVLNGGFPIQPISDPVSISWDGTLRNHDLYFTSNAAVRNRWDLWKMNVASGVQSIIIKNVTSPVTEIWAPLETPP
jgi:hypothetical protein